MNEQFSAFLDNESTRDESDSVVNALLRDERLRESWGRQHWLRETLRAHRGEPAVGIDSGFSTRVMQAIADESAVAQSTVVPIGRRSTDAEPVQRRRSWRNMSAGLAVAASAAGMAFLVTGGSLTQDDAGVDVSGTAVASSASAPAGSVQVATSRDVANTSGLDTQRVVSQSATNVATRSTRGNSNARQIEGPADHWSVSDPALEEELNGYLVEHNGLARGYGLSGTAPAFVRVATYGQEPAQ